MAKMLWCEHGHYPEEAIASADLGDNEYVTVLVDGFGKATNRFSDGTVGVAVEIQRLAEMDEEPFCMEHHCVLEWFEMQEVEEEGRLND